MKVLPMTREDLPFVMEIERESQLEPWSEESFLEDIERREPGAFVARVSMECGEGEETLAPGVQSPDASSRGLDRVAGYICFWLVGDEIQILNIAVHRELRRRGLGGMLLHYALGAGRAKGAQKGILELRQSNRAAWSLYESAGFRKVGERRDYYGVAREPAVLMELLLDMVGVPTAN